MLRVTSVWTGKPGSPWVSTLNFAGDTDSVAAQAAMDKARSWVGALLDQQTAGTSVDCDPVVTSVNQTTGDAVGAFVCDPGNPQTTIGNGNMLSSATQLLVQLNTGAFVNGRQVRGKYYLPGIMASKSTDDGRVTPAMITTVLSRLNSIEADGPSLLVWSRKSGQVYNVGTIGVSPKWAVLRSRRD